MQVTRKKLVLSWDIDTATQDGYLHSRSFPLSLGDETEFSVIKEKHIPFVLLPSFSAEFAIVGISRNKKTGEVNSVSPGNKREDILGDIKDKNESLKSRKFVGFSYLYTMLNLVKESHVDNIEIRQGVKIKLYSTEESSTYILDVEDLGLKEWRGYRQSVETSEISVTSQKKIEMEEAQKIKSSLKLSIGELIKRINNREKVPPHKIREYAMRFIRNPDVVALALKRSSGRCESCENDAPFLKEDGDYYLEVHHIIPLSDGGLDSHENVAAICPNCHRMLHYGVSRKSKTIELINKFKELYSI